MEQLSAFTPTPEDTRLAQAALPRLRALIQDVAAGKPNVAAEVENVLPGLELPRGVLNLLITMLVEAAQGHSVTLIPDHKEMTTQEAADFLNVSRPFVVKQLEQGIIPFSRRGKHRRIKFADVLAFHQRCSVNQNQAMQDLVGLSQELNSTSPRSIRMPSSNFTVVFDACVLYPSILRDILVTLAKAGLLHAKWTDDIHDEWIRSLLPLVSIPDTQNQQMVQGAIRR